MRQRAMIAMAISCKPKLLIADEPTTALDVTIQAQILQLMRNLKDQIQTSIMLITHDLGVVAEVCNKVIVMYGGLIMEKASVVELFEQPQHPYTVGLLQSVPRHTQGQKKRLVPIPGSPPDLLNPPAGCPFAPRCQHAMKICLEKPASLFKVSETQSASCWLHHPQSPKVEGFISCKEDEIDG